MARTNYNTNSVSLSAHSAKSRNYSADVSWTPVSWAGVDASYSKLHLDTISGIAYFLNGALTPDRSIYLSNIHSGTLGLRASAGGRVDFFVGYMHVQDTGSDDLRTQATTLGYRIFPLTYQSPFARVSVRLHPRIRWNVGYQHYQYAEDIARTQNYRAHTGFSSLMWSF
jgi:hypothetical protein